MKIEFDKDVRAFLRINPWFAALPPEVQTALVESGRGSTLTKGQWVYGEGDVSGGLRAILKGSLRVEVSVGPRDVLFEIAGPGAILGNLIGNENRPRLATLRAHTTTLIFAIPSAQILALSEAHPALEPALGELFYSQVSHILLVAAGALCLSPRARVAGRLLLMAQSRLDEQGVAHVTQGDLAEMTGLSRKSVHGHLHVLEKQRIVQVVYGGVRILDPARLEALVR